MTAGVITAMTAVFTAIFQWIQGAITSVIDVFYVSEGTNQGLTFLGVLALVALGISIFFLLVGLVQNFLHLRG